MKWTAEIVSGCFGDYIVCLITNNEEAVKADAIARSHNDSRNLERIPLRGLPLKRVLYDPLL